MKITPNELTQALHWRYATKMFDPGKHLDAQTFEALLESLRLTPSSIGLQPWKFLVIQDAQLREKLKDVSFNQPQVTDASHLIVLCARKGEYLDEAYLDQHIANVAQSQGKTLDEMAPFKAMMMGYLNMKPNPEAKTLWAEKQVYIALGQLMTSAALMGVDACPMEGFIPEKYDEILGLTDSKYKATLVCPVGYRSAEDKYGQRPKVRHPKEVMIEIR